MRIAVKGLQWFQTKLDLTLALTPLLGLLFAFCSSNQQPATKRDHVNHLIEPSLDDSIWNPPNVTPTIDVVSADVEQETQQVTKKSPVVRSRRIRPSSNKSQRIRPLSPHVWLPGFIPPVQQWVSHNSPFGRQSSNYLN